MLFRSAFDTVLPDNAPSATEGLSEQNVYVSAQDAGPKIHAAHQQRGQWQYPGGAAMRQLPIQQNRICVLQLQVRDQLLNARLDGVPVLAFETPLERRPGLLQFTTFDALVDFHEVVLRELDPQTTLIPATSEPAAAAPPTLAQLQTAVRSAELALAVATADTAVAEAAEKSVTARVAAARADAQAASEDPDAVAERARLNAAAVQAERQLAVATARRQVAAAEQQLTGALGKLMAVVEAYPDLKATGNIAQLQEELTSTENKIGFARQLYNDTATNYNTKQQQFPTAIVAPMAGAKPAELWEITDEAERAVPQVKLN